jgi:hypothetical protein
MTVSDGLASIAADRGHRVETRNAITAAIGAWAKAHRVFCVSRKTDVVLIHAHVCAFQASLSPPCARKARSANADLALT